MVSESQKRASARYTKEKVKAFNLRFFPSDADIYEHFQKQPNKAQYLRDLIRTDMGREA